MIENQNNAIASLQLANQELQKALTEAEANNNKQAPNLRALSNRLTEVLAHQEIAIKVLFDIVDEPPPEPAPEANPEPISPTEFSSEIAPKSDLVENTSEPAPENASEPFSPPDLALNCLPISNA